MRKRLTIIAVVLGVACIAIAVGKRTTVEAAATTSEEGAFPYAVIDSLQRASVPIACARTEGGTVGIQTINGSGFFVNRNADVVTAQHVVAGLRNCIPAIYVPRTGWSFTGEHVGARWYRISSCAQDATVDIAVCHLTKNPFQDPEIRTALEAVRFDIEAKPEGTPVAFTSFPLNNVQPVTSAGIVAGYYWENHQRYFLVDKGAWPGSSGSALYESDGRVVGIVLQAGICAATQASCRYDGLTFAKTAGFIDDFLTQHKVPHQL